MAVCLAMMSLTTPTEVGPLGVLVFFAMLYVVAYGASILFVKLFRKLAGQQGIRKERLQAAVVAFGPIMILLLQAFSILNLLSVVATVIFVALGCFLVNKLV